MKEVRRGPLSRIVFRIYYRLTVESGIDPKTMSRLDSRSKLFRLDSTRSVFSGSLSELTVSSETPIARFIIRSRMQTETIAFVINFGSSIYSEAKSHFNFQECKLNRDLHRDQRSSNLRPGVCLYSRWARFERRPRLLVGT